MSQKPDKDDSKPDKGSRTKNTRAYLRYSGLAFQLIATILIFVYLGRWIDQSMENETPWFTLLFAVIAVVGSMYRLIRGLSKM